jgi:hypothetical protein
MLRSRMFTPGFRLFFGIALFLLVGSLLYGISSTLLLEGTTIGDRLLQLGIIQTVTGPLSIGWKGPVGNHVGYGVLLGGAAIATFLAVVLIAFRDADPEAEAQVLDIETVPLTRAPSGANYAPLVGAFGLALVAIGFVEGSFLFYAGLAVIGATALTWTVRAWAERATGDPEVNQQVYARIIDPLRVPVLGGLVIAFLVLGLSRALVALPDTNASRIVFLTVSVLFFAGVLAVYFLPRIAKPLATALLVLGALVVLAGGIYGLTKGERTVEPHHGGEPAGAGETHEGGLAPVGSGVVR